MSPQKHFRIAFGILVLSMMVLGSIQVVNTALASSNVVMKGSDDILGYDAANVYKAGTGMSTLNAPAADYGHLYYRSDQYDGYKIPVSTGDEVSIYWYWYGSASGIDLYFYNTDKARSIVYNQFEYTKTITAKGNGYIYFAIDGDKTSDRGYYWLDVSIAGGADTTAPDCTITYPVEDDSYSGTLTVTAIASDNVGVDYVECGGSLDYTAPYQWTLDTTAYDDGYYYIECIAYDAAGNSGSDLVNFYIDNVVEPDTEDPTIAITTPTGGTVSGSITITVTADDNVAVDYCSWNGLADDSAPYSWIFDTTAEADGNFNIVVYAFDAAGNSASDSVTVNIDNSIPADDGGLLTDGVSASGHMDSADGSDMFWIDVPADVLSMRVLLEQPSGDFDTYGKFGSAPTTSSYDWRGYTTGGEDNTVSYPAEGRHYIMVDYYSGDDDYTLTVTFTFGGSTTWGTGGKYAIIVGISDYQSISDLSYCDEDATDIYNFFNGNGYECHVYGDGHTGNYPVYTGDAYEAAVRNAIQDLAAHAQSGDTVIFTTSGHGSGDGKGSSFLCMLDCSGSAGCYYDYELQSDFSLFAAGVNIMVFVDHCYSGGLGPELMAAHDSIYITTTCTEDGYGWDDGSHQNGAWTYEFFEKYWVSNPGYSAEYVFDLASASYPHTGGDAAMEFDNFPGSFYI